MSNDIYNDTDNNENNDKDSRMIVLQIKRKKNTQTTDITREYVNRDTTKEDETQGLVIIINEKKKNKQNKLINK